MGMTFYFVYNRELIVVLMNLETVNTVVASFPAIKLLLLFVAVPEILLKNAETIQEVDELMKQYNFAKNNEEIRSMLYWTKCDEFKEDPAKKERNGLYIKKLKSLKKEFLDFYLKVLPGVYSGSREYPRNCDVDIRIGKYLLQIMRLRMVIEPEIQIATNKHTQTNHDYLAVKAFWLIDSGVKVRKFTRSIGRIKEYKDGIKDLKAREEGIVKIQERMYETYLEAYPE